MTRQHMALGSLAAVIALVAAVVVLTMPATRDRTSAQNRVAAGQSAAPKRSAAPVLAHSSEQILRARSFTTSHPASWRLSTVHGELGFVQYRLSSSAPVSLGVPPAGGTAITIGESPTSAKLAALFARFHVARDRVDHLFRYFHTTPPLARGVTQTLQPRTVSLGGVEAAETSYTYTYDRRTIVQSDVLALRGDRIVLVTFVAEPAVARAGEAGLAMLTSHWRWL